MENLSRQLQDTALFCELPESVIREQLVRHGHCQEYAKGQFLIEPQQQVNSLGVVLSGKVHMMHLFPEGSYSLMSVLTPGRTLGADLICTRSRISPYHMVAAAGTRVFWLPRELLVKPGMLSETYRLTVLNRLLTLISHENMKKEYRLAILSQKGLRERILTYLRMQSARRGETTFAISFSREELAAFLCVNRSALSHELSQMQQEELIQFRKNTFTLCRRTCPQGAEEKHRYPKEGE